MEALDILEGRSQYVPTDHLELAHLCEDLVAIYRTNPTLYAEPLLQYSLLLPPEWSVLLTRDAYKADKAITKAKSWMPYAMKMSEVILAPTPLRQVIARWFRRLRGRR